MTTNILITGKPGIGKTTAIKIMVDKLDRKRVAGFWSKEIREKGNRVGFAIETLSGKMGILAHVNITEGPKVSKYGVKIEDIDSIIVPELVQARESGSIIIIDEIATMELFSRQFLKEVRSCLDTKRVLGTIQERRHPFLDEVRSREDVELFTLTLDNRNRLPIHLLELLKE